MKTAATPRYTRRGSRHTHPALPCPIRGLPAHPLPPGTGALPARRGRRRLRSGQLPGQPDRGGRATGPYLVPSTRASMPAGQLLWEALAGRWVPVLAAPRKEGRGRALQLQRKKTQSIIIFLILPRS